LPKVSDADDPGGQYQHGRRAGNSGSGNPMAMDAALHRSQRVGWHRRSEFGTGSPADTFELVVSLEGVELISHVVHLRGR
jgi:hypothetical protein